MATVDVYLKKNNTRRRRLRGNGLINRINDNIMMIGARNSGKTNVIANILDKCIDSRTHVFIFSATGKQLDPTYRLIAKLMHKRNISLIFYNAHDSETELIQELSDTINYIKENQDYDAKAVYEDAYANYKEQLRTNRNKKNKKLNNTTAPKWMRHLLPQCINETKNPIKPRPLFLSKMPVMKFIMIFDDIPKSVLQHSLMLQLMRTNRHLQTAVIISIQHVVQANKRIYGQLTKLFLFKNISYDDFAALNKTRINIANGKSIKELYELYRTYTDKPYDFAIIDVMDQTIKHNFSAKIVST